MTGGGGAGSWSELRGPGGPAYRGVSGFVHRAQDAARPAWRWAVTARGRDATTRWASRSCLVLAPHPDDETLGCGATVARKAARGAPVRIVVAADGRHSHVSDHISPAELGRIRAAEAIDACGALGLPGDALTQLGFEDARLDGHMDDLVRALVRTIDEFRPDDIVVTSSLDWHPDHQALNRAARAALAGSQHQAARLLEYPVWHWADGPWLHHGPRSLAQKTLDLLREPLLCIAGPPAELVGTGPYLERKREALRAYRSQTTNLTGEPTWAVMDDKFLDPFLRPYELFRPIGTG